MVSVDWLPFCDRVLSSKDGTAGQPAALGSRDSNNPKGPAGIWGLKTCPDAPKAAWGVVRGDPSGRYAHGWLAQGQNDSMTW